MVFDRHFAQLAGDGLLNRAASLVSEGGLDLALSVEDGVAIRHCADHELRIHVGDGFETLMH